MAKHLTFLKGIVYTPTLIDAVSVTTTSSSQLVAGAKGVGIEFSSAAVGATMDRVGTMTITVSMDGGTNFRAYNMLIENAANTNSQTLLRVASKQISATAASHIYWMTPETLGGITHIKATLTRDTAGTAGTFSVKAIISY